MKRFQVVLIILLILLVSGCGTDNQQSSPDCVISNSTNDEYNLTIIANQDEIEDKEEFAKQLIEQVYHNDFKTIMFSFDETGYPTRLQMTVYLDEKDWKKHDAFMNVSLEQKDLLAGYNIVEHYEKFHLKIN